MLLFHSQCCRTNTDEDHDDNEANNNEHWSQWRCSSVLPGHWDENQESPDIKDVSHWSLINSKSQPKWHIPPLLTLSIFITNFSQQNSRGHSDTEEKGKSPIPTSASLHCGRQSAMIPLCFSTPQSTPQRDINTNERRIRFNVLQKDIFGVLFHSFSC